MTRKYRCYFDYSVRNRARTKEFFDVDLDIGNFEPVNGDIIYKKYDEPYEVVRREWAGYGVTDGGGYSSVLIVKAI